MNEEVDMNELEDDDLMGIYLTDPKNQRRKEALEILQERHDEGL